MKRHLTALVAIPVGVVLAGVGSAATASGSTAAADSQSSAGASVQTVVRKTLLQLSTASGEVSSSAMYTQLSSSGNGSVVVTVPVGAGSARNLDGFGGTAISDDSAVFNLDVAGTANRRIYTKAQGSPIKVAATATLDGRSIDPDQVVNESGVLQVTYTVTNTSTRSTTTSYTNAAGEQVSVPVSISDPIVGSLGLTLPSEFSEISAPGATVAGDGHGGSVLGYQMVLFAPLGNPVQTLTYQARITAGTLPAAEFGFLPIVPYDNSTIATTKDAYSSGADSGAQVADAGIQIGDNLVKLQDGASKLLAGLGQLTAGAKALSDGLTNSAVPGAQAIAAGASQLADGLNNTAIPGAQQLADGSAQLSDGLTDQLAPGAQQVADGLLQVDDALRTLPQTVKSEADYQKLVGGVQQLQIGLQNLANYQGPVLQSFVAQVTDYLNSIKALAQSGGCSVATCTTIANQAASGAEANTNVATGVTGIVEQAGEGAAGLTLVEDGIGTLVDSIAEGLYGNSDWQALVAGGQDLAQGTDDAADGARRLSDGTAELSDGLIPAADGATALADGGEQLADGLVPAADGAEQIADGLAQASDGAAQIGDGAGQLKAQGADKLAESGADTAASYAAKVAALDALQAEGKAGAGIPYGPATGPGTTTTGAYQIQLAAASDQSSDNLTRYLLAAVLLAVATAIGVVANRPRKTSSE